MNSCKYDYFWSAYRSNMHEETLPSFNIYTIYISYKYLHRKLLNSRSSNVLSDKINMNYKMDRCIYYIKNQNNDYIF